MNGREIMTGMWCDEEIPKDRVKIRLDRIRIEYGRGRLEY